MATDQNTLRCVICKRAAESEAALAQHLDFDHEVVMIRGLPCDKEWASQLREILEPAPNGQSVSRRP